MNSTEEASGDMANKDGKQREEIRFGK